MQDYEPVSYSYSWFHFIFSLASMYIAMLMTGVIFSAGILQYVVDWRVCNTFPHGAPGCNTETAAACCCCSRAVLLCADMLLQR